MVPVLVLCGVFLTSLSFPQYLFVQFVKDARNTTRSLLSPFVYSDCDTLFGEDGTIND